MACMQIGDKRVNECVTICTQKHLHKKHPLIMSNLFACEQPHAHDKVREFLITEVSFLKKTEDAKSKNKN